MSENNFNSNWQCSCGQINNGKFCGTCGRPRMQYQQPQQYQQLQPNTAVKKSSVSKIKSVDFIVSLIAIIVTLVANLPSMGLSMMMTVFSPFFMMLGANIEDDLMGLVLICLIECVVLVASVLSIIFNIISHSRSKKGPYRKYKPFRIFIAIAVVFSAVASIVSAIWFNSVGGFELMYVLSAIAIPFGIASLVINIIDINSKASE